MNAPDEKTISTACEVIRESFWQKEGVQDPWRFGAFCVSLLPIPVISAAAKAVDRHLGDKSNAEKFSKIWAQVHKAGDDVKSLEESVKAIAAAQEANHAIFEEAESLIRALSAAEPGFKLNTEDGSYQELVHCIVEADIAHIVARNHSTNKIENTNFLTERTHLHASDNSQNLIHGTKFISKKTGTVGMDKILQKGDISIQGNFLGFAVGSSISAPPGGAITFKGLSATLSIGCRFCGNQIQIAHAATGSGTHVQCPKCSQILEIERA